MTSSKAQTKASLTPGDNFYQYVNQEWIARHPLPPDKARLDNFTILNDENTERLKRILETDPRSDEPVGPMRVRSFYKTAMDEETIECIGLTPLVPMLQTIDGMTDRSQLVSFITQQHGLGRSLVWSIDLDVDDKNSQRYLLRIGQHGLGLPDRDYYFEKGAQFKTARDGYRTFLIDLFTLLGKDNTKERADQVIALETKLAAVSFTATQRRDAEACYNLCHTTELAKAYPGLDWNAYLEAIGCGKVRELLISQPPFLHAVLELFAGEPLADWQDYLTVHYLLPLLPMLPQAYQALHFAFYGKVISGAEEQEPRYRRSISLCLTTLAEPIGQLFVEHYFDEQAKTTIRDMVEHIKSAFRIRLEHVSWMTTPTKKRALQKLDTFMPLLGYPDKWREYQSLQLGPVFVENVLRIRSFEWQFNIGRLAKPVDRNEWLMSPATVNAYYWSSVNGITFPAAILQPPFFDPCGDFAANYGSIGVIIGHEMTHGFDDNGSKFDEIGNMRAWWGEKDRSAFEKRARLLSAHYSKQVVAEHHVNGGLVLGEAIADLGGMLIAYDAFQQKIQETGYTQSAEKLVPEQRFFLAFARMWRGKRRPEMLLRQLMTDPHAPDELRVNVTLSHVDAFYAAFPIMEQDRQFVPPAQRIRIW